MSKMVKNVESKEINCKLLFFEKTIRYYIIFNWRNMPVSMSTSMFLSMDTDMDRDMEMDHLCPPSLVEISAT
jgi:hypothetical protein